MINLGEIDTQFKSWMLEFIGFLAGKENFWTSNIGCSKIITPILYTLRSLLPIFMVLGYKKGKIY